MMRALMSVGPPAGNGTTILIGRLGKFAAASCAEAGAMSPSSANPTSERAEPHDASP